MTALSVRYDWRKPPAKKPRRKMERHEERLQKAVAAFLTVAMPPDLFWFHPPNGGGRSKAEAGIFKAMGVKAGVPDLVFLRAQPFCIELKSDKGRASPTQIAVHDALLTAGVRCFEARSVEEVEGILRAIGIKLKATTGVKSHLVRVELNQGVQP